MSTVLRSRCLADAKLFKFNKAELGDPGVNSAEFRATDIAHLNQRSALAWLSMNGWVRFENVAVIMLAGEQSAENKLI